MSQRPRPGCTVAFKDLWSQARLKPTLIGLVHRWSGREDAHLRVIVLDKKDRPLPYLLYADGVVVVTGYEDLAAKIITILATTDRGKRAAAEDVPDTTRIAGENHHPTERGRLDMHDVPYRTADVPDGNDGERGKRGWNRNLDRYLMEGGRMRGWIERIRDEQPRYVREVVLPNAHGPRQKANLHALIASAV